MHALSVALPGGGMRWWTIKIDNGNDEEEPFPWITYPIGAMSVRSEGGRVLIVAAAGMRKFVGGAKEMGTGGRCRQIGSSDHSTDVDFLFAGRRAHRRR